MISDVEGGGGDIGPVAAALHWWFGCEVPRPLIPFGDLLSSTKPEEHQKNTRRNTRRTQKEKNTNPPYMLLVAGCWFQGGTAHSLSSWTHNTVKQPRPQSPHALAGPIVGGFSSYAAVEVVSTAGRSLGWCRCTFGFHRGPPPRGNLDLSLVAGLVEFRSVVLTGLPNSACRVSTKTGPGTTGTGVPLFHFSQRYSPIDSATMAATKSTRLSGISTFTVIQGFVEYVPVRSTGVGPMGKTFCGSTIVWRHGNSAVRQDKQRREC